MAGMLQEEHPFIMMFLKMYLVYTSSWVHFSTKFNGVFFFGLIMYVKWRRCEKNSKKVSKRVSKIVCFLGQNYGRLKTRWKTTTFYLPNGFGCHFQRLTPIELQFYMVQPNTCNILVEAKTLWVLGMPLFLPNCFVVVVYNHNKEF